MKKKIFTLLTLLLCVCSGAWATDYGTFTVGFDNGATQTRTDGKTGDYFTLKGTGYQNNYACKYNGTNYAQPWKLASSSKVEFTTLAKSTVTIVMSTARSGEEANYPKFDGTALTAGQGSAPSDENNDKVYVFTLSNIAAGAHNITRSAQAGLVYVKVEYTEEPVQTYTASFANGGHGTAPSTQEDVAFVTLPTIGVNFYAITGWKADQDVTVDDATVTAGTLIAVGKDAYLSANTTFTAQWTTSDFPYVDGITFPATLPETALNMYTQSIYTPTNGYVVLEPRADVVNGGASKNFWYTALNMNGSGVKWTAPEGSKYPSSASSNTTLLALRNTYTYAFKFTGTTEFEAMLNPRKNTFEAHVLLVDMTNKSIVDNLAAPAVTGDVQTLTNENIKTFSGLNATHTYVAFFYSTCDGTNGVIYGIALKNPTTVSGTITDCGWSTFTSSYPLDLSNVTATSGATAYYASAASGNTVTLSTTTATVPAGEGIMVKGTAGETFTINTAASGTAIDGNLLKGQTTTGNVAGSTAGKYHYVFGFDNTDATKYGFYNLTAATSIPAGKAYLETTTALAASRIAIVFDDDETTGINAVENMKTEVEDNVYYNLNGQRVMNPGKGLYIVNGKKVIIK